MADARKQSAMAQTKIKKNMHTPFLQGEVFLMPDQDKAFNGDTFACEKFIELRDKYNIKTAIELGSAVGGTTRWLCENFEKVITTEINESYRRVCLQRIIVFSNVESLLGDTIDLLPTILEHCDNRTIIFADDHWLSHCPLLDELKIISDSELKPVLVIHDFLNPEHPEFGYDTYNGISYEWDWIKYDIENIYGRNGFEIEFNQEATGAKRGILFIYPKD